VLDRRRRRHPGVLSALVLGDLRVPLGEALDVDLVDHRVVPGMAGRPVVAPVEVRIGDDAAGHERGAVRAAGRQIVLVQLVRIDGLVPFRMPLDGASIGIEQELGWIAAQSLLRLPGAVDAIRIAMAGLDPDEIAVPDEAGALGKRESLLGAVLVEEAELDFRGYLRKEGEVGARAVVGGAEGIRPARPDAHSCTL